MSVRSATNEKAAVKLQRLWILKCRVSTPTVGLSVLWIVCNKLNVCSETDWPHVEFKARPGKRHRRARGAGSMGSEKKKQQRYADKLEARRGEGFIFSFWFSTICLVLRRQDRTKHTDEDKQLLPHLLNRSHLVAPTESCTTLPISWTTSTRP